MDIKAEGEVRAFNYARTSANNPLEFLIMQRLFPFNRTLEFIMGQGIVNNIAHHILKKGKPLNITVVGEYTIISAQNMLGGTDYLVIDHTTGIVRDVNIRGMGGPYCFSHLQTEWAQELGKELLNGCYSSGGLDFLWDLFIPHLSKVEDNRTHEIYVFDIPSPQFPSLPVDMVIDVNGQSIRHIMPAYSH